MLTFPLLNSGAVAQYPLPITYSSPVQVIRFIDGTDQRFMTRGKSLRTWHIQLSGLNERESKQMEDFFEALGGQSNLFAFPDPYTSELVSNCCLGEHGLQTDYLGANMTSTSLWVVETNG